MCQEPPHRQQIDSRFHQSGGKAVTQRVWRDVFVQPSVLGGERQHFCTTVESNRRSSVFPGKTQLIGRSLSQYWRSVSSNRSENGTNRCLAPLPQLTRSIILWLSMWLHCRWSALPGVIRPHTRRSTRSGVSADRRAQEALHFVRSQHRGQFLRLLGKGNHGYRPAAGHRGPVEETECTNGLIEAGPRTFLCSTRCT